MVLACVLQLTDTDDGARFWWQYAVGAGQAAAAYCLYLHHLSLGEDDTAQWWHRRTDEVQPPPPTENPSRQGRIDEALNQHTSAHPATPGHADLPPATLRRSHRTHEVPAHRRRRRLPP